MSGGRENKPIPPPPFGGALRCLNGGGFGLCDGAWVKMLGGAFFMILLGVEC